MEYIKKIIGKKNSYFIGNAKRLYKKCYKDKYGKVGIIKSLFDLKVYHSSINEGDAIKKLLNNVEIEEISNESNFYYYIDYTKKVYIRYEIIGNLTIDYSIILDNSLNDLKNILNKNKKQEEFYNNELYVIEGLEILIDRIVRKLEKQNTTVANNLKNIKNHKCGSFHEALQRILFLNQQLWQTSHHLMGLGRLDIILYEYYKNDCEKGILTKEKAINLINEFIKNLHKFYNIKSNVLLGDTGQIIELGGVNKKGTYEYNDLTFMFIEVLKELKLPDPKILLRVSSKMPRELMEVSLKCIQTGIGCPLFANDDVIINKLISFGYKLDDAYNYATSACWEPYIIGKALDQNNIKSICFMMPFQNLLCNEKLNEINNYNELMDKYKKYLKVYLDEIIENINNIKFQKDPLLTLFIPNCIRNNKDISEGGAEYNNFGMTSVGLSNLVNSIININDLVFENKKLTFEEFNKIRSVNFENNDILKKELKLKNKKYGMDDALVIDISNEIIRYTSEVLKKKKNIFGGKFKFGMSSPSYIDDSRYFPASFDGRGNNEPFGVHISSENANAYTELIQFSSKLDYNENRFNGNVVDYFVSPDFIKNNFEKFVDFLMLSIKVGFFEMQMNVISSDILIKAKKEPDKFPNLIVRVWGFSAYFNDLPNEYKDYLIERALKSENNY